MRLTQRLTAALLTSLTLLTGCDPEEEIIPDPAANPATVYVVNEGNFNRGNGTVSSFSKTDRAVTPDLFRGVNGRGLGDVVQSMAVASRKGYVVVNNSNKIEIVSLPDFKSVGVITGLRSPRYFLALDATRAYVTQWGNFGNTRPGIKVINLLTNTIIDSIATGPQPERLLLAGGRVFVANSGSNTLSVIDPATNRVSSTLTVGGAPNSLALDAAGRLWVLCGGTVAYTPSYDVDYAATTPGQLVSVSVGAATPTISSARPFGTNRLQPVDLQMNAAKDQLYFRAVNASTFTGPVFRLGTSEASLPVLTGTPFIRRALYGLGIDPRTDVIYGGTGTFLGTDRLIRYQRSGAPLDSVVVGTGPNGFVFN